MTENRAIKYRIYPTSEQKELFSKTFGCCRKVYNLMLADKIKSYSETGTFVAVTPARYKKDYPYLKEVDSLALANKQLDLQKAFRSCFDRSRKKRNKFPVFKSAKHSRKSYTTNNQKGSVAVLDHAIKLPKIGLVKAVIHRKADPEWILKTATVSQDSDGSYYVSVMYAFEKTPVDPVPVSKVVGLDYKSDGFYTDSDGNSPSGDPKSFRNEQKKLAHAQRKLKHMTTGSHNYMKQQKQIAKIHRHIANQRKDFLHKKSTEIANLYDTVCVEDIDLKAMSNKGFGNGKATLDNSYGAFLSMLEYKLADRGKRLVKIDKWYPSSQICHSCGALHKEMKNLNIRVFTCNCGYKCNRDHNAAKNIRDEGIRLITV